MLPVSTLQMQEQLIENLNSFVWNLTGAADMHLFDNNVVIGPGTVLADLNEASFGGYAAITGNYGGTQNYDTQLQRWVNPWANAVATFLTTGAGLPVTIYGWYSTRSGKIFLAERFPTPITLTSANQGITIVPRLYVPSVVGSDPDET